MLSLLSRENLSDSNQLGKRSSKQPFLGRLDLINRWLPADGKRFLEIGCSWGYLLSSMGSSIDFRFGIDINFPDVVEAQGRFGHNATYMHAVSEALPFASEVFHAVVMSEVLEHVKDERVAVAEAARVLYEDGILILTVPHSGPMEITDLTNWKHRLPALHRRFYGWKHHGDHSRFVPVTQYHRHYSYRNLKKLVEPYFEIDVWRRGGFLLFVLADYAALFRNSKVISTIWKIAALDNNIDYGPLSYGIAMRLQKRKHWFSS